MALAIALVGTVSVGVAIAAWNVGGGGTGYAKATRVLALTTEDASALATGDLYPGGRGDLVFRWHNPNRFPVRITEIRAAGPISVDADHPNCVNHGVTFTDQRDVGFDVAPGESAGIIIVSGLTMAADADDGCQEAGFSLPVTAKGIVIVGG
jgi:hypothetical protein